MAAQVTFGHQAEIDAGSLPTSNTALDVDAERVVVGTPGVNYLTSNGLAYVFAKDTGGAWIQKAKLFAADGSLDFGQAVGISGNTVMVGARSDDLGSDSGSVYAFQQDALGLWLQAGELRASDGSAGDRFGADLSVEGDVVVIGAPRAESPAANAGAAYMFERSGGTWLEVQKIQPSGMDDMFGTSVALSGDTLLIGAPEDDDFGPNAGAAYVYRRQGPVFLFEAKLLPNAMPSFFGSKVAIDGNTALVSRGATGTHVFSREGSAWSPEAILSPLDFNGLPITIEDIALTGDIALLSRNDSTYAGGIFVFRRAEAQWTYQAQLFPSLSPSHDAGGVVAGEGNRAFTIAHFLDKVYEFELDVVPSIYCTAKTSSVGCIPRIGCIGSPTVMGSQSFYVQARDVVNNKSGLFFFGIDSQAASIPFLGGTLCFTQPVKRTSLQNSLGNAPPNDCSGVFSYDFGSLLLVDPVLIAGQTIRGQFWYRDPLHPDSTGVGLTDALEFEIL